METLAAQLMERKALDLILDRAVYEDIAMKQENTLSSVEQQAVEGTLKDPTEAPPEENSAEKAEKAEKHDDEKPGDA